MAEKAEKKPAEKEKKDAAKPAKGEAAAPAAAEGDAPAKGGLLTKTPVLLGGVMILEAVVLFTGVWFFSRGPKNANGADLTIQTAKEGESPEAAAAENKEHPVEIELLEDRFPNKQNGHTFLYDVDIFVAVKPSKQESIKKAIKDQDALIKDRVRTIIAQTDPDKLGGGSEPGLETLRRQVKYQLDDILGDGMVDEVLVPRCIPFRTDY